MISNNMTKDVHVKLCLAGARGTGCRLSADDVQLLTRGDDSITTAAMSVVDPENNANGCSPEDVVEALVPKKSVWDTLSFHQQMGLRHYAHGIGRGGAAVPRWQTRKSLVRLGYLDINWGLTSVGRAALEEGRAKAERKGRPWR